MTAPRRIPEGIAAFAAGTVGCLGLLLVAMLFIAAGIGLIKFALWVWRVL